MMNHEGTNMNTDGKLTVWRTDGPLEDMIFEVSAGLTSGNERLIVVDAAGCFDPSRVSRAAASVARNIHVLRTFPGAEQQTSLWAKVRSLQQRTQARRVLLVGVLDHLYDRGILTRDAARSLGRLKLLLGALTRTGLDITVVCNGEDSQWGARTYLVSSLCASAQEVYRWPLPAQEYIDGASAAIA
jgi:hypothetical protein